MIRYAPAMFGGGDPRAMIDDHGTGAGRTPLPLIISVVVAASCVLAVLVLYARQPGIGGASATVVGVVLAVPTAAAAVALVLLVDRLEPEPRLNLLFAFAWGAGIAALLALAINTVTRDYAAIPAFGAADGTFVTAAIVAPVIEETAKGVALLGLLRYRPREIDGPTDGVVYAAMIGIGFALTENVNYYMQSLHDGGMHLAFAVVLRGVIAPLCHPLFTAMIGLGIAYAARHRTNRRRAVLAGWGAAMLLHGLWNGSASAGWQGLALMYAGLLAVLIAVGVVLVADRRGLVAVIAALPDADPDVVTTDDARMLSSLGGRREARAWARVHGGVGASRAMADYQIAGIELAIAHRDQSRGLLDDEAFAHRRDRLIVLMTNARRSFFHRHPAPPAPPWADEDMSMFGTRRHLPGEDLPGQHLPGDDLFGS